MIDSFNCYPFFLTPEYTHMCRELVYCGVMMSAAMGISPVCNNDVNMHIYEQFIALTLLIFHFYCKPWEKVFNLLKKIPTFEIKIFKFLKNNLKYFFKLIFLAEKFWYLIYTPSNNSWGILSMLARNLTIINLLEKI